MSKPANRATARGGERGLRALISVRLALARCSSRDWFIGRGALVGNPETDQALSEEFNRWADAGKGEEMEHDHWPIAKPTLGLMQIEPTDNILDVGCGAGWLSRILAKRVPEGRVVGMDISDEMIHHARRASVDLANLVFVVGEVNEIPWEANFFSRAISVEASYYWPAPAKGIREIYRVLHEGGSAWILINYYRDNPYSHQ